MVLKLTLCSWDYNFSEAAGGHLRFWSLLNVQIKNDVEHLISSLNLWPPGSADLIPRDFYFGGHMKDRVYGLPIRATLKPPRGRYGNITGIHCLASEARDILEIMKQNVRL